jgi:hypothetical protein
LRKLVLAGSIFAIFFLANLAFAQQADVGIGFGTMLSPGAASCGGLTSLCPEKGGLYPTVGGDVIFHRRFGFGYDVTWRAGQGTYGTTGQPYRPIINAFNGVYQPRLGKKIGLDLVGGVGFQDTRAYGYQPTSSCVYLGACFTSSFHFMTDVGGGVRYYFWHQLFIRPEARYYWINNNNSGNVFSSNVSFSSGNLLRVGATIGFTIGGPE